MKVSDYIKQGLKNQIEQKPEDFILIGSNKEGIHSVECYAKVEGKKITDAKYRASKRCKKLLAIADIICEKIKGQNLDSLSISKEEILNFFKEEKEKEKMENRINIILKALNIT